MEFTRLAQLVIHYVNTTHRNIFLTGKAGTGKTTLLRYLVAHTHKNNAIAAPTGIAAINAGGVTLHSLLQLPFGSFVPEERPGIVGGQGSRINTPRSVKSEMRINSEKRRVLQELELLIIDEVSMLRADLLDCIDLVLKEVRRNQSPFGGVQMLFIGDLNQLPPVVRREEWELLQDYYNTAFFFGSQVLRQEPPLYIELDKIYRQADPQFINLLNRLRENRLDEHDIETLNSYYRDDYENYAKKGYIHITTHNNKADSINTERLQALPQQSYVYQAQIEGQFPDTMYPIPATLELKVGAQVMFLKNDTAFEKRYFNGKIGTVTQLSEQEIKVLCQGDTEAITVDLYRWENKRYQVEKATGAVQEEIIGAFVHYPLRLAWAITVHKSQGLTFERAILDLSGSFAPGQMYVALSRLTALEGLVLSTPIPHRDLRPEAALVQFSQHKQAEEDLRHRLKTDRQDFLHQSAKDAFQMGRLYNAFEQHILDFNRDEAKSPKQTYRDWNQERRQEVKQLKEVADKFLKQIDKIHHTHQGIDFLIHLQDRITKARDYFAIRLKTIQNAFSDHKKELLTKKNVKTYLQAINDLELQLIQQERRMHKVNILLQKVQENSSLSREDLQNDPSYQSMEVRGRAAQKAAQKPDTRQVTFDLLQEGLSMEGIAEQRGLTIGTIYGHAAVLVSEGKLDIYRVIPKQRVQAILKHVMPNDQSLGELMERLPFPSEFHELRLVLAYYRTQKEKSKN